MRRLKTFVHISDLHIGSQGLRRHFDPLAKRAPLLQGVVGHDPAVLRYLQRFVHQTRKNEPDAELLVTGDLTAFGEDSQFDAVEAFIGGSGAPPGFVGLQEPHWQQRAVPGNHDQWSGIPFPLGPANPRVGQLLPSLPTVSAHPLDNGRELLLLRLDTDVDVRPYSPERFWACGSFVSGLRMLDAQMPGPDPAQVRVLLLHHSYERAGRPVPLVPTRWAPLAITLRHMTIDQPSRDALQCFIDRHAVQVLLSGHLHEPWFLGTVPVRGQTATAVWEGRCGTTSQAIAASPNSGWAHHRTPPSRVQNTLLVHRIFENDAGRLEWHGAVHVLAPGGAVGFQPAPAGPVGHPATTGHVQLWP